MNRRLRITTSIGAVALAAGAFVIGWHYYDLLRVHPVPVNQASNTAVLGSYGTPPPAATQQPVVPLFPAAPAPKGSDVEVVAQPLGHALAAWEQDGQVRAARYAPGAGWSDVQPLEAISGNVSDLQLAVNDQGTAMAVWRHTLGDIQSLRFSLWTAAGGWAPADVIPGVLPRRLNSGVRPSLILDEQGNATLQWPSAFGGTTAQVTRYEAGRGWAAPVDVAAR